MSGHSKWANIKHKKEASDKKKGKIFSRIAKEIMVCVKQSGKDPSSNPRLRMALIEARAANMPRENIDRAIKKGSGELGNVNYEEIVYEGYGPQGTAIIVECLTDNKNRTIGDERMTLDRNNANLAASGAVGWMFQRKAHFVITDEANADEEKLMDIVLDAGAEDIEVEEGVAEIWAAPESFTDIAKALEDAGIATAEAGIIRRPDNTAEIKDATTAAQVMRLVDRLEELEDVQFVHAIGKNLALHFSCDATACCHCLEHYAQRVRQLATLRKEFLAYFGNPCAFKFAIYIYTIHRALSDCMACEEFLNECVDVLVAAG